MKVVSPGASVAPKLRLSLRHHSQSLILMLTLAYALHY